MTVWSSSPYRLDWTGNHFVDPADIANVACKVAAQVDFSVRPSRYADGLCKAIAASYGIPASTVAVGPGSAFMLDALLRRFSELEIVDFVPNFRGAALAARRDHRRYRAVPLQAGQSLVEAIRPCLSPSGHGRLAICSSPRNPFGNSIALGEIRDVLAAFAGPVIVDECYADFAASTVLPLLGEFPNLYVVRSLSKAYALANARIGFVASHGLPDDFREDYVLRFAIGEFQARLATALLEDRSRVMLSIEQMRRMRASMSEFFASVGFRVLESDANYLCLEHEKAAQIQSALLARGFKAARLSTLSGYQPAWTDGLRISVVLPKIWDQLEPAVTTVMEDL